MACSVDGCDRDVIARGLCTMHYQRMKRFGATDTPKRWHPRLDYLQNLDVKSDECNIWPFGRGGSGSGYGIIRIGGRQTTAHRASLIIHVGPPPSAKHEAAHDPEKCGSILCVNPSHLRWATKQENESDKIHRGTKTKGVKASTSNLSEADVLNIFRSKESAKDDAARYGVCTETVYRIRSGFTWSWLTAAGI